MKKAMYSTNNKIREKNNRLKENRIIFSPHETLCLPLTIARNVRARHTIRQCNLFQTTQALGLILQ